MFYLFMFWENLFANLCEKIKKYYYFRGTIQQTPTV